MGKVVSVSDIMDVNDQDALVKMVERARNNSIGVKDTVRNAKRFYVDMREIKKLLSVVIVSCALTLGAVGTIQVSQVIQEKDTIKTEDVTQEIASLLYANGPENLHGAHYSSIVSKNTIYNNSNDRDNFYYNHEGIAKDLLKLDGDMFDYAFCSVCTDMGKNINNLVGVGGRSNIDSVIFYLGLYSSIEGRANDYIRNSFSGVDNLNDYLVLNNYLDKDGEPSIEEFKKSCDRRAFQVFDSIQKDSKGANIA